MTRCELCLDPGCTGPTASACDPHWDATDAACPCWFRGSDAACATICQQLDALLTEIPHAHAGTPLRWQLVRARIAAALSENRRLRAAIALSSVCRTCGGLGKVETYGRGERWCPVCHPAPQEG